MTALCSHCTLRGLIRSFNTFGRGSAHRAGSLQPPVRRACDSRPAAPCLQDGNRHRRLMHRNQREPPVLAGRLRHRRLLMIRGPGRMPQQGLQTQRLRPVRVRVLSLHRMRQQMSRPLQSGALLNRQRKPSHQKRRILQHQIQPESGRDQLPRSCPFRRHLRHQLPLPRRHRLPHQRQHRQHP